MTQHDRVISDLRHALELIRREARDGQGNRDYIFGVASQAMKNCTSQLTRNADGYLVVPPEVPE